MEQRILLIAEDEPLLIESLVELCQEIPNIQILTAKDGKESFEIIKNKKIDAVLSDINMPKMTGIQVLYEIRNLGFEVPYIFLSGYGDKQNISQALSLNATDFLEKPFKEDELLKVVDRALDLGFAFRTLNQELEKLVTSGKIQQFELEAVKKAKISMIQIRFHNQSKTKAS